MTTREKRPAARALQFALEEPWAITQGALQTILEVAAREHDVQAGLEAIAAKLGQPLKGTESASVRDGIATIPVAGPLFRYANLFTAISGATSYEVLATDLTQALEDPAVGAIVLMIDSPGGTVNGLSEIGELVYESRGRKPIVAMVSDMGASAAYLIASAADVVIASPMAVLGSIGVRLAYQDTKQRDAARGVRTIEIVSSQSPRKAMDPTEDAGRADLQAVADSLAQVLIETVARNRGVSAEAVLAQFGQGGVLVGQAAVDAGLADRIATYEAAHTELAAEYSRQAEQRLPFRGFTALPSALRAAATHKEGQMSTTTEKTTAPAAGASAAEKQESEKLTTAQLAERHPEAASALRLEGATAERTRILAIEALMIAGTEEIIAAAKADPAATPEATAVKLIQHQRANPAAPAAEGEAAEPGKKHLANMAGDEAKANAPSAQQSKTEAGVKETIASLVSLSSLSSLRRANAAAN